MPDGSEVPEDFAELLVGIQRLIVRRSQQGEGDLRLRGAQIGLIRLVRAKPGIGVSAAAKELHLAGNSVSTLVNQLVAVGLLERTTAAEDRRAVHLTVTPAAVERLLDWDARRTDLVRNQVAALDQEDRAALAASVPALRRLAQGLHEDLEGP